jgi:hypothetical protein
MHKRILKRLAFTAILSAVVSSVYAVAPGFYMGFSTGPSTNSGGKEIVQTFGNNHTTATPRSSQWGTSFFMGNKINKWVAVEFGGEWFSKIRYSNLGNVETCTDPFVRVRDVHFMGKGSFSVSSVEVFGKAGLSYIYTTSSGAFNGPLNTPGQPPNQCGRNSNNSYFKPIFAIGASYDLNQSWVADATLTKILVGGQAKSINFYGLGFSYHFVDRYCGQFLCDE